MGLHKSINKCAPTSQYQPSQSANPWRFQWPNTADFNFNYYKLLADAEQSAIAKNNNPNLKIAIIGAGIAGLTAARELFRCGYTHIDIYEASDRLGGRNYSVALDGQSTVLEMGAMRMPFFPCPGSQNSVLDYYRHRFQIKTQDFPDPGSKVADTGIYLNDGYGPDADQPYPCPTLDIWKKCGDPPNHTFQKIYDQWSDFAKMTTGEFMKRYGQDDWPDFWHAFVQHYWDKNFRELVYMPKIDRYDPARPGFFGGLGMDEPQAKLFYTIGAGDGGWGAFYDICCLYPIRTLLFGYGENHQLIQGLFDTAGNFAPGPQFNQPTYDSLGKAIAPPIYRGIQTFSECLFYEPVNGVAGHDSLYAASQAGTGIHFYSSTPVNKIQFLDPGQLRVTSPVGETIYNAVILTPTTWATELGIKLEGFDPKTQLPFDVTYSMKESHWISSCKVFYPLKARYWEQSNIPQLLSTDTALQGIYGYAVDIDTAHDPGVLLASYTWEDDANKFLAETDDAAFAQRCLDELDDLLCRCENIGTAISPFVDTTQPAVIQWSKLPSYRGCAKLYRETTWNDNYALLRYNQTYSAQSGLYFAGEAFSVEGGWTEPALRLALDAVIQLAHNTGASLLNQFSYSDYPKYDSWSPTQSTTQSDITFRFDWRAIVRFFKQ